jgi:hypothetical protein
MNVVKKARVMEAWPIDHRISMSAQLPDDVWIWVNYAGDDWVAVVSPRNPLAGAVVLPADDCVVIRSEKGCLYAVTKAQFREKYEVPLP